VGGKVRVLGAYAKLRKATVSFVMSVRPFDRKNQRGSQWMDFHLILYLSIFRKYVQKIQVSFTLWRDNGYFARKQEYISRKSRHLRD
jgi:hypothetical protein